MRKSSAIVMRNSTKMFRSYRQESIGGGVLMYIHEDLPAIPCQDMIDLEIEDSMWVSVKLNDKDIMLAGIVYRTQMSSDENNIKIIDAVKHLQEMRGYIHILLIGDYNFPEIKWEENTVSGSEQSTAAKCFDATQMLTCINTSSNRPGRDRASSLLYLTWCFQMNNTWLTMSHI